MGRFKKDIARALGDLGADNEALRINMRAQQVRARYKAALESVYGESTQQFLAHTNNVYIMRKDDVLTLIVYVDESIYAAELNAQRELIRLKLLELFNEPVEAFEIHVSRGRYKDNHPYLEVPTNQATALQEEPELPRSPLDANEESFVSDTASSISDTKLADIFKKAMTADMERKKAKKAEKNS